MADELAWIVNRVLENACSNVPDGGTLAGVTGDKDRAMGDFAYPAASFGWQLTQRGSAVTVRAASKSRIALVRLIHIENLVTWNIAQYLLDAAWPGDFNATRAGVGTQAKVYPLVARG